MDTELVTLLVAAGGLVLSAIGYGIVYGLRTWRKSIDNQWVSGVIWRAQDAVGRAVLEVKQTFVDELRDRNGDGKITAEEAKEAGEKALSKAKSYLGTKGFAELGKVLGASDPEDFLRTETEAAVAGLKKK